ncbi:beclin-1-like protein isoform X2 [Abrus precatorius]|uniref:Beclin-1-like protein isoform X2 n=1 Tax=Abrus precatorius TaxID=3816 RepID=A0A8B8K955_ABRPR|nr:beclin-1-like protein isoform X2 [Abrus precatorius]
MKKGDKGRTRTFPVDPNVPRWVCQNCRNPLCIVGVDPYADKFFNDPSRSGMQGSSIHGASSVLSTTKMDNSYVVLPKQRPQAQGNPARPRGDAAQPGKAMEESFVVVYKSESQSDGSGAHSSATGADSGDHLPPHNSGFNATITVLTRAFEIATTQTQVEQPLCLDCMRILSDKLDKEVEDVNRDIEAYEACLKRLEGETGDVLSEADFLKEKLKIEEEERRLEAAIEETERQNAEVNAELRELELKASRFKELEERYWHEFNNFQFQLISHQEERDAILAKIEVSQAHLELLKRTNVLNDAFPISHDGEFGTINNFRLGRLPKIPVEWDEINAAWGQACLLLHTMCQYFRPKFQYPLPLTMFGPVNLFWSTRYDKAMTLFLACLKDFAEFANSKDQENNIPPEKCFKLPYKIENDRVENYSITQSFNKQESWTKALKYTLCNLKWALYWFVGNTNFQPLSAMVSSHAEVQPVGSLYPKRATEAKSESRN